MNKSKICTKCKKEKPLLSFGKDKKSKDGLNYWCKECNLIAMNSYKINNLEKLLESKRKYNNSDEGKKKIKEYAKKNRIKTSRRQREYRNTEEGRIKRKTYRNKYYYNNQIKIKAHRSVFNEIRGGRLIPPVHCSICGDENTLFAHHDDYSKPLEIRWLCRRCHTDWHNENGSGLNG